MKFFSSNTLGLAFTDREVSCALLDTRGGLKAAARFRFGDDLAWDKPEAIGAALKAFLTENGMGGVGATVVGVPARWLIAETREVPPADESAQLAALRLAAERVSLGDDTHLVFDVAGRPQANAAGQSLLVGLAQARLDQLRVVGVAAGLTLDTVTATGLAVANELRPPGDRGRTLVLFDGADAELVSEAGRQVRSFRHVGGVSQRAQSPALWRALTFSGNADVLLIDAQQAGSLDCEELVQRLDRSVDCRAPLGVLRDVPALASLNGQADAFTRDRLWPAVVLAHAAQRRGASMPVNFLHPKLAPPKESRIDRRYVMGVGIAVAVIGIVALLYQQTWQAEALVAELDESLAQLAPNIESAQAEVDRIGFGRTFFETRPPVLDCLNDFAKAMGQEDPVWVTNFKMLDAGRAQVQGRSVDQRSVLALRDRLVAAAGFSNVQLVDLREAAGTSGSGDGDMTFSLYFNYMPVPPVSPVPAPPTGGRP